MLSSDTMTTEKDYVLVSCSQRVLTNRHGDMVDQLLVEWRHFDGTIESVMEFEDGPLTFEVEVKRWTDAERDEWCEAHGFSWEE